MSEKYQYVCPHCLKKFDYYNFWFQCPKFSEKSQKIHTNTGTDGVFAKITTTNRRGEDSKYCATVRRKMGYPSQSDYGRDFIADDFQNGYFKYQGRTRGKKVPSETRCYYCKNKTHTHVCPSCHKEINIDKNDKQFIINLAGPKSSGKSDFLGSVLYMIDRRLSRITDEWTVEFDSHASEYLSNFESRIENKKGYGTAEGDKQDPAIVTFKKTEGKITKKYTFIFYDIAGELLTNDMSAAERVRKAKKFSCPDYIIYFSDPSRIEGVFRDVRNSKVNISQDNIDFLTKNKHLSSRKDTEQNVRYIDKIKEFLGDIYFYNEEKSREEAYGRADTPIGVCLTMIDVLKGIYTPSEVEMRKYFKPSTYLYDYKIREYIDDELEEKSENLITQFNTWEERNFINYMRNNFGASKFFGISALGTTDEKLGSDMMFDFKPVNVLDPFVWFVSKVAPEILESGERGNDVFDETRVEATLELTKDRFFNNNVFDDIVDDVTENVEEVEDIEEIIDIEDDYNELITDDDE